MVIFMAAYRNKKEKRTQKIAEKKILKNGGIDC